MEKLRWGILGCAGIGWDRTLPGIANSSNGRIYAIASRTEEKLAKYVEKFHPEKTYLSYDALLEDPDVDAVYIPLPNALHREWVIRAAEHGKHILCEKPMALTEEEAVEMFAAAEKAGVLLAEAYAYRHAPLVKKVRELIREGAVGKVHYLESTHTNQLRNRNDIRFDRSLGGGAFYDVACYNISLAGYLLDEEPQDIKVFTRPDEETGLDAVNAILLRYASGPIAMLYDAINCYPKGRYSVLGDAGRIDVANKFNSRGLTTVTVANGGRGQNVEIVDEVSTAYSVFCPDNYLLEMEQFARCVLEGEAPEVTKEETIRNARVLDAVRKAAGV